jgi:hypothetical protein
MTDNEIRIAIAEACGWSKFMMGTGVPPGHEKEWSDYVHPLPDYPNDLNAMHEAEKMLIGDQRLEYYGHLLKSSGNSEIKNTIQSTARQRAEAFLRTIGKWK